MDKYAPVVGRILMAVIFIIAGIGKITGYSGTQGYMESMGVPGMLLPLVILTELGGGIALVLGWQTKIVSILLAGFTLLAALIFHSNFGDQGQMINFLKNLAITGGFLILAVHGAGAYSLDNRKG
jgi:putative oxidoreductase